MGCCPSTQKVSEVDERRQPLDIATRGEGERATSPKSGLIDTQDSFSQKADWEPVHGKEGESASKADEAPQEAASPKQARSPKPGRKPNQPPKRSNLKELATTGSVTMVVPTTVSNPVKPSNDQMSQLSSESKTDNAGSSDANHSSSPKHSGANGTSEDKKADSSSEQPTLRVDMPSFIETLKKGQMLTKFNFADSKNKQAFFRLSPDIHRLEWADAGKNKFRSRVDLVDVQDVRYGPLSSVFHRLSITDLPAGCLPQYCFSLLYKNRSLDLCADEKSFRMWFLTLQQLCPQVADQFSDIKQAAAQLEEKIEKMKRANSYPEAIQLAKRL